MSFIYVFLSLKWNIVLDGEICGWWVLWLHRQVFEIQTSLKNICILWFSWIFLRAFGYQRSFSWTFNFMSFVWLVRLQKVVQSVVDWSIIKILRRATRSRDSTTDAIFSSWNFAVQRSRCAFTSELSFFFRKFLAFFHKTRWRTWFC